MSHKLITTTNNINVCLNAFLDRLRQFFLPGIRVMEVVRNILEGIHKRDSQFNLMVAIELLFTSPTIYLTNATYNVEINLNTVVIHCKVLGRSVFLATTI